MHTFTKIVLSLLVVAFLLTLLFHVDATLAVITSLFLFFLGLMKKFVR